MSPFPAVRPCGAAGFTASEPTVPARDAPPPRPKGLFLMAPSTGRMPAEGVGRLAYGCNGPAAACRGSDAPRGNRLVATRSVRAGLWGRSVYTYIPIGSTDLEGRHSGGHDAGGGGPCAGPHATAKRGLMWSGGVRGRAQPARSRGPEGGKLAVACAGSHTHPAAVRRGAQRGPRRRKHGRGPLEEPRPLARDLPVSCRAGGTSVRASWPHRPLRG